LQAAVQPFIDNAISKTVNVPADYSFEAFKDLYGYAYEKGLKGCTTFRPNPVTGAVLYPRQKPEEAAHCCTLEREAD
jgi:ribonucleoside-diphosphate reductase alpha chain